MSIFDELVMYVFTMFGLRRLWYREIYLRSWHWRNTRRERLEISRYRCAKCGGRAFHVHHKTYKRIGREHMRDLQALCVHCHRMAHHEA